MIPRVVKGVGRLQPMRVGSCGALTQLMVSKRLQSSTHQSGTDTTATTTPTPANNAGMKRKLGLSGVKMGGNSFEYQPRINPKLIDITTLVDEKVESNCSIDEKIDIFEEGISSIYEMRVKDRIPYRQIRDSFGNIAVKLIKKMIAENESVVNQQRFYDILSTYFLANRYYYTLLTYSYMKSDLSFKSIYRHILQNWVKSLEFENSGNFKCTKLEIDNFQYQHHHLLNLAYLAYINCCVLDNIKITHQDLVTFLQTDDLPKIFQIQKTLTDLNLSAKFADEMKKFKVETVKNVQPTTNPNDTAFNKKIQQSVDGRNLYNLSRIWQEINQLSNTQKIPINEKTLVKFMNAFYDCDDIDQVFKIFQNMIANGISNPSIETWEIVIRALGCSKNLKNKSDSEKASISNTIERAIENIIESNLNMTSKTLSIIIGSFANLNRFDKVDECLTRFSTDGEGKLSLISPIRSNILIGLVLNDRIQEAESKLQSYMKENNYIPITSVMNTFLKYHSKKDNFTAVEQIFDFMKKHNIPEDITTYTIILDVYFKLHRKKGLVPDLDSVIAGIKSSSTVAFNDVTCTALIDGLAKDGSNIEAARSIYESSKTRFKSSAFMHTSLLKIELDFGSIANAEEIFNFYIKNIRNDTRIWNLMISGLLPKYEDLALSFYDRLKAQPDYSAQPNNFTWYFLLNHFMKKRNSEVVQMLIDDLKDVNIDQLGTKLPDLLKQLSSDYNIDPQLLAEISKFQKPVA